MARERDQKIYLLRCALCKPWARSFTYSSLSSNNEGNAPQAGRRWGRGCKGALVGGSAWSEEHQEGWNEAAAEKAKETGVDELQGERGPIL